MQPCFQMDAQCVCMKFVPLGTAWLAQLAVVEGSKGPPAAPSGEAVECRAEACCGSPSGRPQADPTKNSPLRHKSGMPRACNIDDRGFAIQAVMSVPPSCACHYIGCTPALNWSPPPTLIWPWRKDHVTWCAGAASTGGTCIGVSHFRSLMRMLDPRAKSPCLQASTLPCSHPGTCLPAHQHLPSAWFGSQIDQCPAASTTPERRLPLAVCAPGPGRPAEGIPLPLLPGPCSAPPQCSPP